MLTGLRGTRHFFEPHRPGQSALRQLTQRRTRLGLDEPVSLVLASAAVADFLFFVLVLC